MVVKLKTRKQQGVNSHLTAEKDIGFIEKDIHLFGITRGQYSMIDIIQLAVKQLGECKVSFWTWVFSEWEVDMIISLVENGSIKGGRMVVDPAINRVTQKNRRNCLKKWLGAFGEESIVLSKNHAKIARIWNDDYSILIRGSMNLNKNPRFEQFDITEGGADFELVKEVEDGFELFNMNNMVEVEEVEELEEVESEFSIFKI